MILLIALRIPALAFCECKENLVLNGACCPEEQAAQVSECECCPLESSTGAIPCSDCIVILSLDPGGFTWAPDTFAAKQPRESSEPLPGGFQDQFLLPFISAQARSIRGSPPLGTVPAHSRSQILRL